MSQRIGERSPKPLKTGFDSLHPCVEENKVAWFAVFACFLAAIAVVSSVAGFSLENAYLLAHAGVCAVLAVAAAILSLKE